MEKKKNRKGKEEKVRGEVVYVPFFCSHSCGKRHKDTLSLHALTHFVRIYI